ncbi:MAG: DUF1638 domain-containing protein [Anaerolineae bacterium]
MKVACVCCDIMKHEVEKVLVENPDLEVTSLEFLDFGLHVYPEDLLEEVIKRVNAIQEEGEAEAVFLGYGYCHALEGIENKVDLPVVLPPVEDCIALFLGPRRYAEERVKCAGTWFMTPGWCVEGLQGVIRELHLDSVPNAKYTPLDFARMMFKNYKRALLIDDGAGDPAEHRGQAEAFAELLDLEVEEVEGTLDLLRQEFARLRSLDGQGPQEESEEESS